MIVFYIVIIIEYLKDSLSPQFKFIKRILFVYIPASMFILMFLTQKDQ